MRLAWLAFWVALFGLLGTAEAQNDSRDLVQSGLTKPLLLSAVACDDVVGLRTWTSAAKAGTGFGVALLQVDFTRGGTATGIQVATYVSANSQTTWAQLLPCDDTTDGDCVLTGDGLFKRNFTASENIPMRADFLGAVDIRVIVTCVGGNGADTFNLWGRIAQQ